MTRENLRRSARKDACRIGAVQIDGAPAPVECLVWDISDRGAMIEVESLDVPDTFTLSVGKYLRPRLCSVVRREGRRLGVTFA